MHSGTVPLNDLMRRAAPFAERLTTITSEFFDNGRYVLGPGVEAFEKQFARYCGAEFCIGVANGTDAIEIALKAVNVQPGDHVALCANAAMYGTTAVLACGAEPVFVDIDAGTATMAPDCLRQAIAGAHRVKAVLVTHLYGQLADMDAISAIAAQAGSRVVEDCAQAHGATDRHGRRAGSIGDAASFSFYPTKNLGAFGDGGGVTTSDPLVARHATQLRQYGWEAKYRNALPGGRNSRLDELQAQYLLAMLPSLDGWNRKRREIVERYRKSIVHADIVLPGGDGEDYVGHLCIVRSARRDALRDHLLAHGVQSEIHYPTPDHRQPCHRGRFDDVVLPITERDAATVLTLPCFPELSDDEIKQVVRACNSF
jgi:dTDP-4-amino-4,6-dideoxygalactose transaminase